MKISVRVSACAVAAIAAVALAIPVQAGVERRAGDPGRLPQTAALPSSNSTRFHARIATLWRGIVDDSPAEAKPAFFPASAYLQVKQIQSAAADYRNRLLANYRADIHAVHVFLGPGARSARLLSVPVPKEWAWIPPEYCYNRVGYWHAPGSRLVYREGGRVRSFGIFSLISWRGEWYVVHLAVYDRPGTVDDPSAGPGSYGLPGGC